jgi:hypothetical protein
MAGQDTEHRRQETADATGFELSEPDALCHFERSAAESRNLLNYSNSINNLK